MYDDLVAEANSGTETRAQQLQRLLMMNPGITFAQPNAWAGGRPVFFTDAIYLTPEVAGNAYMSDPAGISGTEASVRADYTLTDAPTGPTPTPVAWTLPAYRGPSIYLQSADDVARITAQFSTPTITTTATPGTSATSTPAAGSKSTSSSDATNAVVLDPTGRYLVNGTIVDNNGTPIDAPAVVTAKLSWKWILLAGGAILVAKHFTTIR